MSGPDAGSLAKRVCECPPCPGRGNDGHGLTHCAECCFGTGVEADVACPIHGQPPAPQGGDVESLVEVVLAGLRSAWRDDYSAQSVADGVSRHILASDWLAARDAEVERAVAERIAAAWDEGHAVGYREHADDTLAGHGISVGPVTPNPYRARAEGA